MRIDVGEEEQPEISLIALIDCIFFLLMFFMVATSFQKQAEGKAQKQLPITLPESAVSLDKSTADPSPVVIGVDVKGGVYWGREPVTTVQLRERLHANARYFRGQMQAAGFNLIPGEHPIIPVMLGEAPLAVKLAERVQAQGVYVVAFAFPVVPHGKARIRTQMSAAHTTAQLDRVVEVLVRAGRDLGIIK